MIKLYGMTLSAHTRKVQTALLELGLPYELVVIDLNKGEQHNPEYVKLNPGGKTPTLVDGDLVVIESNAILMYLAETYGKGKLIAEGTPDELVQNVAGQTGDHESNLESVYLHYFEE